MSEIEVTQLTDLTTPARGDYLYIIDDPAGNPASRRTNIEAVLGGIAGIVVAASNAPGDWKKAASYVCDGTNDEVQIQAAIDALDATYGDKVSLSPGLFTVAKAGSTTGSSYNINHCILIDENDGPVTLEGQGWGCTIIKIADTQDANTSAIVIRGSDDTTGKRTNPTIIRGIEFDGNGANQADWPSGEGALIQLAYANYVTLDTVYPHGARSHGCQVLRNSQNFVAKNCRFPINAATGGFSGLRIESPKAQVSNCHFMGDNDYDQPPFQCVTNADIGVQSSDVQVVGCTFDTGRVLAVIAGNRIAFVGCSFINATYSSAWALKITAAAGGGVDYNTDDAKVIGCSFQNIRQGIEVSVSGTCLTRRAIIANNTIVEGGTISLVSGIVVNSAGVQNAQILNNIIVSATTAITDNGTSTVDSGNVVL